MVVQRKWMYLESIFIGGDIRAQLPEEAKKFDDIDKTFKKVKLLFYYTGDFLWKQRMFCKVEYTDNKKKSQVSN